MNEKRKLDDKLTIRCEKLKGNKVREVAEKTGLTLNELLVEGFLNQEKRESIQVIKLNEFSRQCKKIEDALSVEKDKEIFRKGMEEVWAGLLIM